MERSPLSMGVMVGSMWNSTPISLARFRTAIPLLRCFISTLLMGSLHRFKVPNGLERSAAASRATVMASVNLGETVGIDADLPLARSRAALSAPLLCAEFMTALVFKLYVEAELAAVLQKSQINRAAIAALHR